MRKTWKRTVLGMILAGIAGGAALGLGNNGFVPATIPPSDGEPQAGVPMLPIIPAIHFEESGKPMLMPVQSLEPQPKLDPSVSLEWAGPPVLKVNSSADYTLTVTNTSAQTLQKVAVQVKMPKDSNVKKTTPEAKIVEGVYLWEIGTMEPKAIQAITMNLHQAQRGELAAQAWVTFTGTAGMKVAVREPKLDIRVKAPEKVILGDKYQLEYTVTNIGDFVANDVRVGMTGSKSNHSPRALKPGEQFTVSDTLIATPGGMLIHEAVANGNDGLVAIAKANVQVLVPKLDIGFAGPADCLIGKRATYTLQVRNSGDIAVTNLVVREHVPASFRVLAASAGGLVSPTSDVVSWNLPELAPGAVHKVTFEASGSQPGAYTHLATADGNRNTKASTDGKTRIDGIPALRMEMVDLVDPVEKGGETTYEVKITNTGSKSDTDLQVACIIPPQMKFKSATGPVAHKVNDKGEVTFEMIRELAPKTEAVVRVTVTATSTGDARFKAMLNSKHLNSAVTKEESTRVYGE